jgi:hypothetical protein
MATPSIASLIDALLDQDKVLSAAVPDWRDTGAHGQHRLIVPVVLADGISTGLELEVHAYPDMRPLRFNILLNYGLCVWRIDHEEDDAHINSLDAPPDIAGLYLTGPHYHAWDDNKRFCTHNSLPNKLKNARVLGNGIRSFDSALRWLCGEARIGQPPTGLITLPPKSRLL